MTVYADVLFAVNFTALFLLLYVYSFLSRTPLKIYRVIFVSVLCGVYSVAEVVYSLPYYLRTAVLFCFLGIVFGMKTIVRNAFYIAACATGIEILVLGFITMIGKEALIQNSSVIIFVTGSGGGLLLFAAYTVLIFGNGAYRNMKKRRRISLNRDGRKTSFYALYDSGNLLRYDGKGVIITVWDGVCDLFGYEDYNQFYKNAQHFAAYKSVSGDGIIPLFSPEKCFVNFAEKDVYIGVIEKKLFGDYTAIVGDV